MLFSIRTTSLVLVTLSSVTCLPILPTIENPHFPGVIAFSGLPPSKGSAETAEFGVFPHLKNETGKAHAIVGSGAGLVSAVVSGGE
jgi:hypothetical protein